MSQGTLYGSRPKPFICRSTPCTVVWPLLCEWFWMEKYKVGMIKPWTLIYLHIFICISANDRCPIKLRTHIDDYIVGNLFSFFPENHNIGMVRTNAVHKLLSSFIIGGINHKVSVGPAHRKHLQSKDTWGFEEMFMILIHWRRKVHWKELMQSFGAEWKKSDAWNWVAIAFFFLQANKNCAFILP